MYSMQVDQDVNCRMIGRCTYGSPLDREVLDLVPRQTVPGMTIEQEYSAPEVPLSKNLGRQFLYVRYNADLSGEGLKNLGCSKIDPVSIQKLDGVENVDNLIKIGRAAGKSVKPDHFGPFLQNV